VPEKNGTVGCLELANDEGVDQVMGDMSSTVEITENQTDAAQPTTAPEGPTADPTIEAAQPTTAPEEPAGEPTADAPQPTTAPEVPTAEPTTDAAQSTTASEEPTAEPTTDTGNELGLENTAPRITVPSVAITFVTVTRTITTLLTAVRNQR
jgi:hypothetical protein